MAIATGPQSCVSAKAGDDPWRGKRHSSSGGRRCGTWWLSGAPAGSVAQAAGLLFISLSFLVSPVRSISARKVEKTPGRVLFHVGFEFECGAIGTIAMGTIQSRGTPVERIELMGDHQRIEVEDVVEVRWHRNPPFKIDDPAATLSDDVDTLTWKPNFTAAANEDPKGYYSLLADVVPALAGAQTAAPTIADGVIAMERLETIRGELSL